MTPALPSPSDALPRTGRPPVAVSEELFADLYIRVERLEADLARLRPDAARPAAAAPRPTDSGDGSGDTQVMAAVDVPRSAPASVGAAVSPVPSAPPDHGDELAAIFAAVRGYGELLAAHLPAGTALGAAARAVAAAADLGDAVRRRDAGPAERTDVRRVLAQVERFLASLAGAGVRLAVAAPAGLPAARCRPGAFVRAVLGLVRNAQDAMPGGGLVTVRAAAAVVRPGRHGWPRGIPPGEFVVVTVTDTGHGMDAATRANLFTPGFTTRPGGRGRGLAAVAAVVADAGGHVEVESDPRWGTTVAVYVPKA